MDILQLPIRSRLTYAPPVITSTCLTDVRIDSRVCRAERIVIQADPSVDADAVFVRAELIAGPEHQLFLRRGAPESAAWSSSNVQNGEAFYVRRDRPLTIYVARCDGNPIDASAQVGFQMNDATSVPTFNALTCR